MLIRSPIGLLINLNLILVRLREVWNVRKVITVLSGKMRAHVTRVAFRLVAAVRTGDPRSRRLTQFPNRVELAPRSAQIAGRSGTAQHVRPEARQPLHNLRLQTSARRRASGTTSSSKIPPHQQAPVAQFDAVKSGDVPPVNSDEHFLTE